MRPIGLFAVISLAFSSPAMAQSINLRFGPAGGAVPDASYAAAGPAGYWNLVSDSSPTFLRGLDGSPTMVGNFVPSIFSTYTFPPVGPVGNDALLLSSSYGGNYPEDELTINGLANGQYNVIFYGLNDDMGFVGFFGQGGDEAILVGNWPGSLAPGVYASLPFNVAAGTLSFIATFGVEGGSWTAMQIVQVPGPGVLGVVGAAALMALTRQRRR